LDDDLPAKLIDTLGRCNLEQIGLEIPKDNIPREVFGRRFDRNLMSKAQDAGMGPGIGLCQAGQVEILIADKSEFPSYSS